MSLNQFIGLVNEMSVEELCECIPCLCCDCPDGTKRVKEVGKDCDSKSSKICCEGHLNEHEVF